MRTSETWRLASRLLGAGVAAIALSCPVRASAQLPGELSVTRDDSASDCPGVPELTRTILALGMREPSAPAAPVRVEVYFARDAWSYWATIRAKGGKEGVRELRKSGDTCAALAEATSVIVALLLDFVPVEEAARPPQPAPAGPLAPAGVAAGSGAVGRSSGAPSSERSAPEGERTDSASKRAVSIALGVNAGVGYGVIAQASSPALGAAVAPRFGSWEASAGVLWLPSTALDYESSRVEVSLVAGRAGGCFWFGTAQRRFGLATCLSGLAGVIHGRGDGFDTDLEASDIWLAVEAAAHGRLEFHHQLALRLSISALVPRRHTFSVEGEGVVVETAPVAFLATLGPELRFW